MLNSRSLNLLCLIILTAIISPLALPHLTAADHARKPNVLLIYTDDHGWADLGLQGADPHIRTPHLDQLVRDGVRFTRGYVTAPQCVPSRAGVITGRYQQRFGVEDNSKGPLPLSEITIAERLKPAGYTSGWVGKSHLDIRTSPGTPKSARIQQDHLPPYQGFAEYFRGEMNTYFASHALNGTPFPDAPRTLTEQGFRVNIQTEAALSFLDRRQSTPEQPWFLYLAWYAPHVPLESPEPWFSQTPADRPKERRQALAMIAAMDDGVGRIRNRLREIGQDKDTLIFFIGDNGAPLKQGAWNGSINLPLVGEKGMLTDGGLRTPFVAAWPGTIPAGQTFAHPVSALDVAATANAVAELEDDPQLDGTNLLPYLTGQNNSPPHKTLYWRWRSQAAVLQFPWKLIQLGDHERYLFNVTEPDGELTNLLEQHPDIAARLQKGLAHWFDGLQPPGPAEPNNDQDNLFFAAHVDRTIEQVLKRRPQNSNPGAANSNPQTLGWICRNGSITVQEEALSITPDDTATGRTFLARTQLNLTGPVTATLRLRADENGTGKASISWRTPADTFAPHQTAPFTWPQGTEFQNVTVTLPEPASIIHLRITPPANAKGLRIQSVQLLDNKRKSTSFRFRK